MIFILIIINLLLWLTHITITVTIILIQISMTACSKSAASSSLGRRRASFEPRKSAHVWRYTACGMSCTISWTAICS